MREGSRRWALGDGGVWEDRARWKVCLEEQWPGRILGDTDRRGAHREQLGPRVGFKGGKLQNESSALSWKFAVDTVRRDGAERTVWGAGRRGGRSVHC